jgi:hypothetical protein
VLIANDIRHPPPALAGIGLTGAQFSPAAVR